MRAGIALARNADALPIARSRLDAHFDGVRAVHHAFAMANVAYGAVFAGAAATWTRSIELHPVGRLRHLPRAFALRACVVRLDETVAMAVSADVGACDVQLEHRPLDRLPKSYVDLIIEIGSRLRPRRRSPAPATEHRAEDVFEPACASGASTRSSPRAAAEEVGEVEALKIDRDFLPAA